MCRGRRGVAGAAAGRCADEVGVEDTGGQHEHAAAASWMASGSRRAVAASAWHALVSSCVTDSIHCWIFLCLRSWGMGDSVRMDSVRMDSIHFGQNARFNFLTAHGYHWHAQELYVHES